MIRHLLPLLLLAVGCDNGAKTLIILHTTDEHSHVLGFGPELDDYPAATSAGSGTIKGGAGRRAAVIAVERARAKSLGADSILVSAGDNTMGTLVEASSADFQLMKSLGYDATTLGNHELDFGPKRLAQALGAAQSNGGLVPTLASNLHFSDSDSGDDELAALYDATGADAQKGIHHTWVMTTANQLKVGFIGIVGVDAAKKAAGKAPVTFSIPAGGMESDPVDQVLAQLYQDVQPAVDQLRNVDKVDLVIALSHSGVDEKDRAQGEDYRIAQNVSGIDVIISGHTHLPVDLFTVTNLKTGKPVYVQQANCFGQHLGRMTISLLGGKVSVAAADSKLIPIDDTIVSDAGFNAKIDGVIAGVEALPFLPATLGRLLGAPIADDTSQIGDLYFHSIGKTAFTVVGKAETKDTPLMDLWADAELAAVEAVAGPTVVSIVAQGALRADLDQGKSGDISFADVFRSVPLGLSPADNSLGSPLCRANLLAVELKAAFEVMAGYAYTTSDAGDFFLVGGGIKVEYDTSRPTFDAANATNPNNGRITKMTLATDHTKPDTFDKLIFDVAQGGFTNGVSFGDLFAVTANLYVMDFAYVAGVTLKDQNGQPLTPTASIVHRADGSEIKDWEAVGSYIRAQPSMTVPARYMTATHLACSGPLCK